MARSIKIPTSPFEFADGETEKTVQVPTLDFAGKATDVYDFKVKLLHPDQGSLVGFIPELTVQVMNEDQLPENRKEVDDQDPKLHYSQGWHHETDNKDSQMAQNLGLALTK